MSRSSRTVCTLVASALILSQSACALFSAPMPPAFEAVQLDSRVEPNSKYQGLIDGNTRGRTRTRNALVYGGTTAVGFGAAGVGAAWVSCGPSTFLFPICFVPMGGVLGGLGAFAGFVGGGAVGFWTGLPEDKADLVSEVTAAPQLDLDLAREMKSRVTTGIPSGLLVVESDAPATVILRLDEATLKQHFGRKLSLSIEASMIHQWSEAAPGSAPRRGFWPFIRGDEKEKRCRYEFSTEKREVDAWTIDDGAAMAEAFTRALDALSQWMVNDLASFRDQSERVKSADQPASCFQEPRWYHPWDWGRLFS